MAIVGCLTYEFQVTLPVVAARAFHGGARTYGFMTAAMGVGAVVGGLVRSGRGKTGLASLVRSSAVFAVLLAARRRRAEPVARARGARRRRSGERHVHLEGQQHAAARGGAADARAGDGAVGGRVPRLDPDRRPDRRRRLAAHRCRAGDSGSARSRAGWRPCSACVVRDGSRTARRGHDRGGRSMPRTGRCLEAAR